MGPNPGAEEEEGGSSIKLEVQEFGDTSGSLILTKTNPGLVNALRRTLISDVPRMAIEDVEFHLGPIRSEDGKEFESVTPLFDEIISHRLGMIHIPTDLELFEFREKCKDCKGEGCPNCTIMYALNKKGPSTVYSGDLEPVGDPKLKVADEKIPIVKLDEGQAVLIYATAILGTGKAHAKWQVAHGVGYKFYPVINVNHKKWDGDETCIEVCPTDVFKIEKGKIAVKNPEACIYCMLCEEACGKGCVEIDKDTSKILFHFETDGSLSSKAALTTALRILEDRFGSLSSKAAKLK
ncbi:MAG: DNA-directed RNA polymerase subunit D [Methanobacteriota archaeon]|nr:MAG: DNA-directed RNA polymerase subunit D [Euryarchaeota archaeon]